MIKCCEGGRTRSEGRGEILESGAKTTNSPPPPPPKRIFSDVECAGLSGGAAGGVRSGSKPLRFYPRPRRDMFVEISESPPLPLEPPHIKLPLPPPSLPHPCNVEYTHWQRWPALLPSPPALTPAPTAAASSNPPGSSNDTCSRKSTSSESLTSSDAPPHPVASSSASSAAPSSLPRPSSSTSTRLDMLQRSSTLSTKLSGSTQRGGITASKLDRMRWTLDMLSMRCSRQGRSTRTSLGRS